MDERKKVMMISRRASGNSGRDSEFYATIFRDFSVDGFHILNDIMGTAMLDVRAFVTGAYCDDGRTTGNTSADAARRILEDDTLFGIITEALSSEQERVRGRLSCLQTLVVSSDSDWRWYDSDTLHATICCQRHNKYARPTADKKKKHRRSSHRR